MASSQALSSELPGNLRIQFCCLDPSNLGVNWHSSIEVSGTSQFIPTEDLAFYVVVVFLKNTLPIPSQTRAKISQLGDTSPGDTRYNCCRQQVANMQFHWRTIWHPSFPLPPLHSPLTLKGPSLEWPYLILRRPSCELWPESLEWAMNWSAPSSQRGGSCASETPLSPRNVFSLLQWQTQSCFLELSWCKYCSVSWIREIPSDSEDLSIAKQN